MSNFLDALAISIGQRETPLVAFGLNQIPDRQFSWLSTVIITISVKADNCYPLCWTLRMNVLHLWRKSSAVYWLLLPMQAKQNAGTSRHTGWGTYAYSNLANSVDANIFLIAANNAAKNMSIVAVQHYYKEEQILQSCQFCYHISALAITLVASSEIATVLLAPYVIL